jgi:outer membrane protein TolC
MQSRLRYLITVVVLSILMIASAPAQQKLSLTVEKCIELGLENSKALHSSLMKVQAADAKIGEANAARLPSLKFNGGYTRLSDVPAFEVSLPFQLPPPAPSSFVLSPTILNNYNLRLTLQQALFTGFRLESSKDLAEYTAEATQYDYNKDKSDVIFNIRSTYWTLFKAIEFKKVIDENVGQVKAHLKDVQSLLEQGMATNNDVLKVQVQLSDVQLRQIDAKNAVRLATISLNNLLGLPLITEIELESGIKHQPKEFVPLAEWDALVQKAVENRPEVKGMEYRVKAGESGVTLAKSGWFPQVFLVGNYNYARPNQRILPTQDTFKDTWDISVSVSYDIWNWGTTIRQTEQAQSQLAQAQDALGQIKDGIAVEVTQSYLNVLQAKEKIAVAEQGVKQAEENYRITNEKFKEGLALNSDLLDAEVALLQAKTNYTQALVDYELSTARLQKAIGE